MGEPYRGYPPRLPISGNTVAPTKSKKVRKRLSSMQFAESVLTSIFLIVGVTAGAAALGLYIGEGGTGVRNIVSPDMSDETNYPNAVSIEYLLPDHNRFGENQTQIIYNVAIDLHSKSFSAHMSIKGHAAIAFDKASVPAYYFYPDKIYVYFVGSHNLPPHQTGLGYGSYTGYLVASKASEDNATILYEGTDFLQYEMSGQFPILISWVKPSVEKFDPSLASKAPLVNIASEEATNAYLQQQIAEVNERHQTISNLAIIFASFMITIPAVPRIIRLVSKPHDVVNPSDSDTDKKRQSTKNDESTTDQV